MRNQADRPTTVEDGDHEASSGTAALLLVDSIDLEGTSGIAIITDRRGVILEATEAATALRVDLEKHAVGWLAGLVLRAQAEGLLCEPFTLSDGEPLELIILPLGHGGALVIGRSVSIERILRVALIDSRQRYKDLVECSSDFVWETDTLGCFVFVSPCGALGYDAADLSGRNASDFIITRNDDGNNSPFFSPVRRDGVKIWMRAADGAAALLDTACIPLYDVTGRKAGVRGVCRDITLQWENERAHAKVRLRARLVNSLIDSIRDATDYDEMLSQAAMAIGEALAARICIIYRAYKEAAMTPVAVYGEAPDEELSRCLEGSVNRLGDDREVTAMTMGDDDVLIVVTRHRRGVNGALCVVRPTGHESWHDEDKSLVGSVAGQLGVALEQLAIHESLLRQSLTDELTGLKNRRAFMDTLAARFGQAMRSGRVGSLIYLDLDNFKRVNDIHGHQRGDEVLKLFSSILATQTRVNDVAARLGGDEFALWLDEVGQDGAASKGRDLLESCKALKDYSGDADNLLSVSIGIAALDPQSGETMAQLIARADEAMYQAKKTGKASYAVAPPTTDAKKEEEKEP